MARVSIEKDILLWAIERSGLGIDVFEARFPKIHEWVEGIIQPTLRQAEMFAKASRIPFGYLFLAEPVEERLPLPYFRTAPERAEYRPSPELLETVHTMQVRQQYMREILLEDGIPQLEFVGSAKITDNPLTVAAGIRRALGLKDAWAAEYPTWKEALRALEDSTEQAGILVMANGVVGNNTHRKLDPQEFRGFVLIDEFVPLVFLNRKDAKAAQMFTLAHEIAHVWFGQSAAFDLRGLEPADDATEQACDKVAAELLVPEAELRALWPNVRTAAEPFQIVARRFKVSVLVAARRAKDLGLVTRNEFFQFYEAYLVDERRKRGEAGEEGGDFYATQTRRIGKRFAETIIRATREGKLLYKEAYKLTGLRGKTFDQFAAKLLGEGAG
jgi:Zn-dependent peptidase ImmA (M78 family)